MDTTRIASFSINCYMLAALHASIYSVSLGAEDITQGEVMLLTCSVAPYGAKLETAVTH